ncbi:MAG: hypothetical protein ACD_71C00034G0002 [uncultured bacterium (gcode 4)]|uniref:HD domain-containing protein n=3 Tax=Bacteria TaxID=2 RepID=K2A3S5_9BACT|nr:MAG: hypothetical protein ACD_71C00034G0002 [uncultured bacterium (gcode 4)]KKR70885.1 MAG: Metal dependent phosphohydrolase [Candidatus Roizmanbacteria bacterium GW2011_GWB1_40_7]KKR91217.1 MAG: Metal dependent phosphohydrolase [Candidatus Roizmanbacteria bacterium GW2011_GWA1_41_13]KKS22040.1 MAG: Metal dependent phosphohydrolase [Microgenomates group bacterium GW2011_GWC1_41_8]OGK49939.1 MAG: hypothetical protein A3A55_03360 [Candidatus Roizmanbacteria bacterium RIFCSPLOWO2_01_FULL_40_14]
MEMALVHDLGESIIGDAIYESGTETIASLDKKHEDERRAIQEIFKDIPGKEHYISLWEEWVAQKTPEATFLKRIEKLEMAMQALEYERLGHDSVLLNEFWENAWKYLKGTELEKYYHELQKQRNLLQRKK